MRRCSPRHACTGPRTLRLVNFNPRGCGNANTLGHRRQTFVSAQGILAGVIVALTRRYDAYVVAGRLGGIVIDLLTYSGFYDIALRAFGLMLGALTLARLASVYDPRLKFGRR